MMKASAKRRRTKAEIEEEKLESMRKEQEIRQKLEAWEQMEAALEESERKNDKLRRQSESMKQIYEDGLIKKDDAGSYVVVDDPAEQEQIKARRSKPKKRGNVQPEQMYIDETDPDKQEGDLD